MAISAKRFNFLDKETNIGIKDFTKLTDNQVYTGYTDVISTDLEKIQDSKILNKMSEGFDSLSNMLMNDKINDDLKNALNSVLDTISNMDLPETAKDALNKLKEIDENGLRDFLKDTLRIGKMFFCNNLDFLKIFSLGYAINPNVLFGLLLALLLSWLDRICKGYTPEESLLESPIKKINQVIKEFEVKVTTESAFNQFINYYSDFLKSSQNLDLEEPLTIQEAVNRVINGDIDTVIDNIFESEASISYRNDLIQELENQALNFSWEDEEHDNIYIAIGNIRQLPLVSSKRREKNIRYEHFANKFGSYIKNLVKVELQPVNFLNLNEVEKRLYLKMIDLKNRSMSDTKIQSIPNDSFSDFDFNSILPPLDEEEKNYLLNKDNISDSHRLIDLHPTSEVFLED